MTLKRARVLLGSALLATCVTVAWPAKAQKWVDVIPPSPGPRESHSAVFDPQSDSMVIFGGDTSSGTCGSRSNDVWVLKDATGPVSLSSWVQLPPAGTPPNPRLFHTAVFDQSSNRMTVFGGALGFSSPCVNDVWVLDHANGQGATPTWVQLSPSGTAPAPRGLHSAIYDAANNRMTIFAGQDCFSTLFNDVWVLSNANGLGGTPTWTQLAPAGGPPSPREVSGAGYDPSSNRMITFGGTSSSGRLADVWVLTNANGLGGTPTWIQLTPSGTAPSARDAHSTVYDATTNTLIIFDGVGSSLPFLGDTWVLSHAKGLGGTPNWTQLTPIGTPPAARGRHSAVFDPAKNRMTIFGGDTGIPTEGSFVNDVFVLERANGMGP